MASQGRVPKWIREFSYPGWKNVFQLVPNNKNLYPMALRADWKNQFNDWNGKILLLAKDGCPPLVIRDRINRREPLPWRYGQRELGDEMGWITNENLYRFASTIPGGKLYGSAAAHMLYDDDRTSRQLSGFKSGLLHDHLKDVLCWVLESMPLIKWVACLGEEAWFLTCMTIGNPLAARRFKEYRDSRIPVVGGVGNKRIRAFPLYHPAAQRVSISMQEGWQAFAAALSAPYNGWVDPEVSPLQSSSSLNANTTRQRTKPRLLNYNNRNSDPKRRRVVTATLPKRHCRVQFMIAKNTVHTSPDYHSGNTWAKIISYARSKRGGAPANLPLRAVAIPQVLTAAGWIEVNEYE